MVFDLGQNYRITRIRIWNNNYTGAMWQGTWTFNLGGKVTGASSYLPVQGIALINDDEFDDDYGANGKCNCEDLSGRNYYGELFDVTDFHGRYVEFDDIVSLYPDSGVFGFSEIQFFGWPVNVNIDAVNAAVKAGSTEYSYDLDGNGLVQKADVDYLVETLLDTAYGDANLDRKVDVGDLGILAANYGNSGKTWGLGDFNGDGTVDVGDLGILAANYGAGTVSGSSFDADYEKVFGSDGVEDETDANGSACSSLGLPMIVGVMFLGMMLVKLDE